MLAACLLLFAATTLQPAQLTASSPGLRISYEDFRKLYDRGQVLVLDTRGDGPYRVGHIPGAESLPLDAVDARIPELQKEKKAIVTYCS